MEIKDFVPLLSTAKMVKEKRTKELYNAETQKDYQRKVLGKLPDRGHLLYLYPPIVAWLLQPLANFEITTAYKLFTALNILALATCLLLLKKLLKLNYHFLVAILFFPSILYTITTGQLSFFLLLIFTAVMVLINRKQNFWAGFLLGTLLIKPQYLISFPLIILIVENKKPFLKGFVLTTVLITLLNLCIYGKTLYNDYNYFLSHRTVNLKQLEQKKGFNIFSGRDILNTLTKNGLYTELALIILLVVLYLTALANLHKRTLSSGFSNILFSSVILFTLTINFHTKAPDLALLIIPICVLYNSHRKKGSDASTRDAGNRYDVIKKTKISLALILALILFVSPAAGAIEANPSATLLLLATGFALLNCFQEQQIRSA